MMEEQKNTAQAVYEALSPRRNNFLERSRACAEVTIPALVPPEGLGDGQDLPQPHQSIGAMAVNTLASKLGLSLMPTNQPFFKLDIADPEVARTLDGDKEAEAKLESALAGLEREAMAWAQRKNLRTSVANIARLLIVSGNALLLIQDGKFKVFSLSSYVVQRSSDGTVVDLVIKESVKFDTLDEDVQELLKADTIGESEDRKPKDDTEYEVYTRFYLNDGEYHSYQEVGGFQVPDSEGSYTPKEIPFIALRWTALTGEDYGRGHVEEYIGDLNSLEDLTQAIVESSKACAKTIFLKRPGAVMTIEDLANADNLSIIEGNPEDVTAMSVEKVRELAVARQQVQDTENRIARAFLMNGSIQRDAERVTAEEIRTMAMELEDALGGVYSLLATELQLPLVHLIMSHMKDEGEFPDLPENLVEPAILTGIEALGRGHDLNKLMTFARAFLEAVGPDEFIRRVNISQLGERMATGIGLDKTDLLKSDEQYAQERQAEQEAIQQQQMVEMAKQAVGPAAQAMAKGEQ